MQQVHQIESAKPNNNWNFCIEFPLLCPVLSTIAFVCSFLWVFHSPSYVRVDSFIKRFNLCQQSERRYDLWACKSWRERKVKRCCQHQQRTKNDKSIRCELSHCFPDVFFFYENVFFHISLESWQKIFFVFAFIKHIHEGTQYEYIHGFDWKKTPHFLLIGNSICVSESTVNMLNAKKFLRKNNQIEQCEPEI